MTSQRAVADEEMLHLNLELDEDRKAEKDYEEMLKQEAERLSIRGYVPKVNEE
jgi:hypothetical protein